MAIVFSFYYIENTSILKDLYVIFLALTCNLFQHNHWDLFLRTQPMIFKDIISNPKHKTKKKSLYLGTVFPLSILITRRRSVFCLRQVFSTMILISSLFTLIEICILYFPSSKNV